MKIGFVAGSYIRQRDGISVYTENLLRELVALLAERFRGACIEVFSFGEDGHYLRDYFFDRIPDNTVDSVNIIFNLSNAHPRLRYPVLSKRLAGREDLDCLLLPNPQPVLLPRTPCVTVYHDLTFWVAPSQFSRWRRFYAHALLRYNLRRNTAIGYISQTTRAHLTQAAETLTTDRPWLYMPNGLPGKLLNKPRPDPVHIDKQLTKPTLELLFVGRINRLKGFEQVLSTCAKLDERLGQDENTRCILHVVGKETPDTSTLLGEAHFEHIELRRYGYLSDEDLNELYRRSGMCFFLSKNEGFGLPALEAIWLGCVPILSDIPIFREITGEELPLFPSSASGSAAAAEFILALRRDEHHRARTMEALDTILTRHQLGYRRAADNFLTGVQRLVPGLRAHMPAQPGETYTAK